MSISNPFTQMAKYLEEKKIERERERERERGHNVDVYGAHRSARSSSSEGQRAAVVGRGQRECGLKT